MADAQHTVHDALDAYSQAIHAGDARAAIAAYTDDATVYDLASPLVQPSAMVRDRAGLEQWFATWDGPVRIDADAMTIEVAGDLAVAWSLRHMTGIKVGGAAQSLWFRSTAVLRRDGEMWKIAHLHESVPFAMDGSGKALLNLTPEES